MMEQDIRKAVLAAILQGGGIEPPAYEAAQRIEGKLYEYLVPRIVESKVTAVYAEKGKITATVISQTATATPASDLGLFKLTIQGMMPCIQ